MSLEHANALCALAICEVGRKVAHSLILHRLRSHGPDELWDLTAPGEREQELAEYAGIFSGPREAARPPDDAPLEPKTYAPYAVGTAIKILEAERGPESRQRAADLLRSAFGVPR